MEFRKYKDVAASIALVSAGVGVMATANYFNQPRNPKDVECVAVNNALVEPPPPYPTPDQIAQFLHVDKLQVVYGAGGRVACNNIVSLGNIANGIALKVDGVNGACMATLEFPPDKKYRDDKGSDRFDVFCPAPADQLPVSNSGVTI